MQLHDFGRKIANIVKELQMKGFRAQHIALMFDSKTSPIQTIQRGGTLQIGTIQKLCASMNTTLYIVAISNDPADAEAGELRDKVHANNLKMLNSVVPTFEAFMETNGDLNMRTGLVKRKDSRVKEMVDVIEALN